MVATIIAVYGNWGFADVDRIGWGWALSIWLWDLIWFIPLDLIKIMIRCVFERDFSHM